MRDMEKICLIIPCYNEENRLNMAEFKACAHIYPETAVGCASRGGGWRGQSGAEFDEHTRQACKENFAQECPVSRRRIPQSNCDFRVYFIFADDGSSDGTAALVKRHAGGNIACLELGRNCGKAEAVRRGMLYAKSLPEKFDYIGFWDADLATPLGEAAGFVRYAQLCGGADAVFGCRLYRLGSAISRSPVRHLWGRLFATAAKLLLGIDSYDSQCGAKLFRPAVIEEAFGEPFVSRWIFDVEIILRLKNRKVIEYPLQTWSDVPGGKITVAGQFFRVAADLLAIRRRMKSSRPLSRTRA